MQPTRVAGRSRKKKKIPQTRVERQKARLTAGKVIKRIIIAMLIVFFAAGIGCCAYAASVISKADKINTDDLYKNVSMLSTFYDDEGKELESVYTADGHREILEYDEIPQDMIDAIVSIEDKTFWKHHGFNIKRMIGAVKESVFGGGEISGTSTITQQLARNIYLSDIKSERTISRKITEAYYTVILERNCTKKQILEAYLNVVYFGYGNYGIETAANSYFGKTAKDMDLIECASLAALPQSPDANALIVATDKSDKHDLPVLKSKDGTDYLYNGEASKERRDLTISLMKEEGYITSEEASAAAEEDLQEHIKVSTSGKQYARYFTDYVIDEVTEDLAEELGIEKDEARDMVYKGGLSIQTTLNTRAQKILTEEINDSSNYTSVVSGMTEYKGKPQPQAAAVILDNKTGNIIAMCGGRGAKGKMLYNRAIHPRQPGSSVKPIAVYGPALQQSYELAKDGETPDLDRTKGDAWGSYITARSYINDAPMTYGGKVWPKNAYAGYRGKMTLRNAVQQSVNVCAVKVFLQVGEDYSMDMLKKEGITSLDTEGDVNDINPAALALGGMTNGISPLELAAAYEIFPSGGMYKEPAAYTKVLDQNGDVLLEKEQEMHKVYDEGVAWIMTDILHSVVTNGIGYNASISSQPVGGKTGTTSDHYDIWFSGFTPQYTMALWEGCDTHQTLGSYSETAALFWSHIMGRVCKGTERQDFRDRPENVIYHNGEYFVKGTDGSLGYGVSSKDSGSSSSKHKKEKSSADDTDKKDASEAATTQTPTTKPKPTEPPLSQEEQDWYDGYMND